MAMHDRPGPAPQKYYDESRHAINLVSGLTDWRRYVLVTPDEAAPPSWYLMDASDEALQVDTDTGEQPLRFASYSQGEAFLNWLERQSATMVGKRRLYTHSDGRSIGVRGALRGLHLQLQSIRAGGLPECHPSDAQVAAAEAHPVDWSADHH